MWEIGVGRADITRVEEGVEMLGWAMPINRVAAVAQPLLARAVVLRDPDTDRTVALVTAEICMMTQSIREAVYDGLREAIPEANLDEQNLSLAATHTHSAPGGYSYDLFYTMTAPGFRPQILHAIVHGIVDAICQAWRSRTPGVARMARRSIPLREPVAFNRAWEAYSLNQGIAPVAFDNRDAAVNREMTLLRFEDASGAVLGAWTWFAVHCTSVHSDNRWIHPDNKGVAATMLEELGRAELDSPDFVAGFAQGAAGDVSPNFRFCKDRNMNVGMYDDDFQSARFNGAIQFDHARKMLDDAASAPPLSGPLDGVTSYLDFRNAPVDPRFANGRTGRHTAFGRIGMPFMEGTDEGPGPLHGARRFTEGLREAVKLRKRAQARLGHGEGLDDSHGPMYPFLESGRGGAGKAFGAFLSGKPFLPGWFDPTVAEVRRLQARQALGDRPWTPNVLPVQLLRIGELVVAGLPCEPTTMCGRRIDAQLRAAFEAYGVRHTLTAGYANGYAGYLTTWEEYQRQGYEGGGTYFGQWTLGAYQTRIALLIDALKAPAGERHIASDPPPCRVTDHELEARMDAPREIPRPLPFLR